MITNSQKRALLKPFNHKWRVQRKADWGAFCTAYIDARDVEERLDEVFGVDGWSNSYEVIDDILYCSISIKDEKGNLYITKTDCGTESVSEKEKGQASDAFKRAAVRLGIGRYLYRLGEVFLPVAKNQKGFPEVSKVKGDQSQICKTAKEISEFAQSQWLKYNGEQIQNGSNQLLFEKITSLPMINPKITYASIQNMLRKIAGLDYGAEVGLHELSNMTQKSIYFIDKVVTQLYDVSSLLFDVSTTEKGDAVYKLICAFFNVDELSFELTSENPLIKKDSRDLQIFLESLRKYFI